MDAKSLLNLQTKIANDVFADAVVHTLSCDYICGGKTLETLGLDEARIAVQTHDKEPFSCPHCGGNQTERRGGKTICAYCLTEMN